MDTGALDYGFSHWTKLCDVYISKMQVGTGSRAEKIRTYNFKVLKKLEFSLVIYACHSFQNFHLGSFQARLIND